MNHPVRLLLCKGRTEADGLVCLPQSRITGTKLPFIRKRVVFMKYKIEKNTVQETLILPLYSRKLCSELYPNLYRDETAVRLIDEIDYDFSEAEKNSRSLMQRFGALEVAMRQNDLAFEVQAYLKNHQIGRAHV